MNDDLEAAFDDRRVVADRIAQAALDELTRDESTSPPPVLKPNESQLDALQRDLLRSDRLEKGQHEATSPRLLGGTALLLAGAAATALGLAGVWWLLAPHQTSPPTMVEHPQHDSQPDPLRPAATPVATLAIMLGDVQAAQGVSIHNASADPVGSEWTAVKRRGFRCPPGGHIRTGANALAELETTTGCIVRMNANTQIRLANPTRVELLAGQIWVRSPQGEALRVIVPSESEGLPPKTQQPYVKSQCIAGAWVAARSNENVLVASSQGTVRVESAVGVKLLKPGESMTCGSAYASAKPTVDLSWTHPLLAQQDGGATELNGVVDRLLAGVGATKASWLNERQLRALGERGVLPLLRFVRSEESKSNRRRRLEAMRIASDLAPLWVARDLVALLADEDGEIRSLSATALTRLTGLQHGRAPEMWKEPLEQCQPAIRNWKAWLDKNSNRIYRPAA